MEFNEVIYKVLSYLRSIENGNINKYLESVENNIVIKSGNVPMVSISSDSIKLWGNQLIQEELISEEGSKENTISEEKLITLLKGIAKDIIRINHLGIGYNCKKPSEEIKKYSSKFSGSPFKIYEEISDNKFVKWHYLGNLEDIEAPLFEIVLTESNQSKNKWSPHFQIDIDTRLDSQSLNQKIEEIYHSGFDWELNMPNGETVVGMKIVGEINGTKLCLGISTRNRDFLYHRQQLLKEIR